MKIEQLIYVSGAGWENKVGNLCGAQPQLVLVFGGRHFLEENEGLDELRRIYPEAHIVAASTWGAIVGSEIIDDTITATAIPFEKTRVACAVAPSVDSRAAGKALAEQLRGPELAHVFVVSDGLCVNGTDLVGGFNESLPPGVLVLGQRIEEETENVRAAIGQTALLTGFYSNGELAPAGASVVCDLHNQTMSVTSMREV